MKRSWTIGIAGSLLGLALVGCPPSETTTATPGTGTVTGEVGGGAGATPAPSTATTPGAATADPAVVKDCVAVFDKMAACSAEYLPTLVETRVKLDFPAGIAERGKDEAGKKALLAEATEEWKTDSVDPKKTEMCTKMASSMDADMKADKPAVDACLAKADCKEFVACWAPLGEKHIKMMKDKMAAGAAAPAGTAPAPAK